MTHGTLIVLEGIDGSGKATQSALLEKKLKEAGKDVMHISFPDYASDSSFRAQSRNLPCTLLFLASFAKGFPFSAVSHTALYRCARKIPRLRSG